MTRTLKLAAGSAVLAATLMASACASYDDGRGYGNRHYARTSVSVGYYDGWYDGHYGPVHDGYWGDDRFFYYRASPRGPWIVDRGNHFRRDRFDGGRSFHYRGRH
jgi:hypothetical protein